MAWKIEVRNSPQFSSHDQDQNIKSLPPIRANVLHNNTLTLSPLCMSHMATLSIIDCF